MDKILQQFLAIAESGSFSRAAQLLSVTQPTLTFNIRKLEESLGVTLFKRTARGAILTPYGVTLFQNARVMRKLYDNTIGQIERQRIQSELTISIGVGYTWWILFLRDWVLERRTNYPDAPVHVSVGNQLRCMDQLLAGEFQCFSDMRHLAWPRNSIPVSCRSAARSRVISCEKGIRCLTGLRALRTFNPTLPLSSAPLKNATSDCSFGMETR